MSNEVDVLRQVLARSAPLALAFLAAITPSPASATEPVGLYPCPSLLRLGAMDESGTITRPTPPAEMAADMIRLCDRVVLGRFVSVADSHYHKMLYPADEPVVATFHVSETLWGEPAAVATIGLERGLLAAPDEEVSRLVINSETGADELYRYELGNEMKRELTSIRDSGKPLTHAQHERLADALKRLVEVPPRTRYELHGLARTRIWTQSPLTIYNELGAVRPDEVYLLGLSDENTTDSLLGATSIPSTPICSGAGKRRTSRRRCGSCQRCRISGVHSTMRYDGAGT